VRVVGVDGDVAAAVDRRTFNVAGAAHWRALAVAAAQLNERQRLCRHTTNTLLYPPSELSDTGGYTVSTFVCLSVCVSVRTQSSLQHSMSLPQRISHLPDATHLPPPAHVLPQTCGYMHSLSAF